MDANKVYEADHETYTLGEPAADAYEALKTNREPVCEMGRMMAELTVPSVFPPLGYIAGDDLPGNNQSFGALCVNNLASKLMFMAFPPGQPIMTIEPVTTRFQKDIDADPALYGKVLLACSQLEVRHRKRLQQTPLATAYVGYMKLLIVGGNALWKHVKLDSPSYHRPDSYVVSRDRAGHPLLSIHEEVVRVATLDDDVQDLIYEKTPELLEGESKEWEREVKLYSVCQLRVADNGERTWCYWQEYEGTYIPDSGIETDYDDCPQWPGWLIPVFGSNWGRGYCEEYRGDLFTAEANASSINDIAALAGYALLFVKPSSRTSLRQVRTAKNLEFHSGSAEDLSVFRSEKTADGSFIVNNLEAVVRRLGSAFLLESAVMRQGERVTKEEVVRVGNQLDRAMGGVYTEVAQGNQRRIILRAMRLHEEADPKLPRTPDGVFEIGIITGIDAMGRSNEDVALSELGAELNATFGPQAAAKALSVTDFATRKAAAKGIKPDGLVRTQEQIDAETQAEQQAALQGSMVDKATGPMAGALAGALIPPPQQQPPAE